MGNWNSSSGTGTTDDAYSSGPGQNYSSSTTSSSNDNNDFFSGTFDDPGEPGFSGPSYEGQYGTDSDGDYYGPGDVGEDFELDKITAQFDALDKAYETTYGSVLGFGGQRGTIAVDAMGRIETFSPFGERVSEDRAAYAARVLGETELAGDIYGTRDVNVPGLMDNFERAVGSVANAVTERFGTSLERDYVVGLDQGFIGQVTEDYSGVDAIGNLIGMAVPGGAQVDSARAKSLRTSDPRELEYQYSSTLFGQHSSLQTAEELAASRAAAAAQAEKERQMGGGQAPFTAAAVPAAVLMEAASRGSRSRLLGNFLRATAPSIYPQIYQMFNEGGEVEQPQAQAPEEQVEMMMAMPPMKEIAADPQKFLKDPNSARTAEETQNIYRYNKQILDLAKTLPKPKLAVEGGVQGEEPKVAEGGPAGFVGQAPEQLDEATTVADDVPMEVAEGTFVINAAAVEHAGSDDIKKMILTAMEEARNQGIDTSGNVNTIDRENAVSLLVSRGEVIVPPLLAKIIGYDRLNKINNRGKEEVKKRVEENGQSPEAEALDQQPQNPAEGMTMAEGGESFIRRAYKTIPTNVRLLLEYMAGSDSPITEKDFTEAELKEMAAAIEKQRGQNVDRETQLREMVESGKPYRKLEAPKGLENLTEFFGDSKNPIYVDFKGNTVDQSFVDEIEKNEEFRNALMERAKNALASYENTRDTVSVGGRFYYRDDVERPSGYEGFVDKLQDPTYQLQTTVGKFKAKDSEDLAGYTVTDTYDFNSGELGFESNEDITLQDIWDEREKPQMMAELMARYLRPEGGRPVEINLERAQQADSPTMADGGVAVRGSGSTGPDQKNVNLEAEVQGEGFIAKPRLNYSQQTNTQQFPDGVVVDEKGKSLGFAVDGQMFLKDDKSLRAGFERQASNFEGQVNLPEQYGGETIEFGGGSKMKRYNMGATFGPVDVDLSKTQVPNGDDVLGGSVRYRFSENGDVTLEATDDGRSGRIGLNYRF